MWTGYVGGFFCSYAYVVPEPVLHVHETITARRRQRNISSM